MSPTYRPDYKWGDYPRLVQARLAVAGGAGVEALVGTNGLNRR